MKTIYNLCYYSAGGMELSSLSEGIRTYRERGGRAGQLLIRQTASGSYAGKGTLRGGNLAVKLDPQNFRYKIRKKQ